VNSTNLAKKQLPDLNRALEAKQLGGVHVISEEDWRKLNLSSTGAGSPAVTQALSGTRFGSMF
jgi:hypothetical protein